MRTNKFVLSLTLGVVFWLLAALFIRSFGGFFFRGPTALLLGLFVACLPLSRGFMQTAKRLGRLNPPEVYDAMVVMTGIATLLDGVAIVFLPSLYGPSPRHVMLGAGLILWGAGCGLAIAYGMKHQGSRNLPGR